MGRTLDPQRPGGGPRPLLQLREPPRKRELVRSASQHEFLRDYFDWWLVALDNMRDVRTRKEAALRRGLDIEDAFVGRYTAVAVEATASELSG